MKKYRQPIFYGYPSFMNYEFSDFQSATTFTDPYTGRVLLQLDSAPSLCTFTLWSFHIYMQLTYIIYIN